MAKQRSKRGRPRKLDRGVVYRLTITLHPRHDAAIIARIESAEPGQRSAVVVDMMRNGASGSHVVEPVKHEAVEVVSHAPVDADF